MGSGTQKPYGYWTPLWGPEPISLMGSGTHKPYGFWNPLVTGIMTKYLIASFRKWFEKNALVFWNQETMYNLIQEQKF